MKSKRRQFDSSAIELINANGPFNHSHWDGAGLSISHEEGLKGRADFLVKKIREVILKNFTISEIKKMSIADVGCYDGWILHQLSDLPFKELVGIEPRTKNINKGINIRKILGIKTRVKFRKGSIDSLNKKDSFDIVLCIGVFHHLESISLAMEKLDSITKKILIIDTIVLPSSHITDKLKRDIEAKDLIYQKKKLCGLIGEKFESSYYDGSTSKTGIVSLPTTESLLMHLDILDYGPVKIAAGPTDFKKAMKKNKRQFDEVLLSAVKNKIGKEDISDSLAKDYEAGLFSAVIDQACVDALSQYFAGGKKPAHLPEPAKAVIRYIESPEEGLVSVRKFFHDKYSVEIIKNLRFNTSDKLKLESGKNLYFAGKYAEAIKMLEGITQKINSDWRAVYRAFYLLSLIYRKQKDTKRSGYYEKLCKMCNANFPLIKK